MKKNKIQIIKIALMCFLMSFPLLTFAASSGAVQDGLDAVKDSGGFDNSSDILGADNVVDLIGNVIKLALYVSGAIAVLFVIIGGFLYLTAHGNDEQATKGRKTITNALIGIIIIILSYVIVNVVVDLVNCGTTSC